MKKLILLAVVLSAVTFVRADVLYWMVSDEYAKDADPTSDAVFASLYVKDGDTIVSPALATASAASVFENYDYSDYFATDISSYAGNSYSFFIELANGVKTNPETYQTLVNNGYITTGGIGTQNPLSNGAFGQAAGSATYNVPEPTSGLLFLIGGMLLGLKRRRQQV